jgi:hypothetical protein
VLRLYDAPVYVDWAFWMTVAWGALAAAAIPSDRNTGGLPVWLNTLLATITFIVLFGVVPAWIRLLVRRWLWRRRSSEVTGATSPPSMPPPTDPARPAPTVKHTAEGPAINLAVEPAPSSVNQVKLSPELLMAVRQTFPYPVAHAMRTLSRANTAKEQYEALLDAAEALAITLSVTAVTLLRQQTSDDPSVRLVSTLRRDLLNKGATFGTWTNWLKNLDASARTAAQVREMLSELVESLQEMPARPGLFNCLDALRIERNRHAHGNRPQSEPESARRVADNIIHLERALSLAAGFLTRSTWLLTISCAYQPRSEEFEVAAHQVIGDHPDFERMTFSQATPVGNATMYLRGPKGLVALVPFVANLFCERCQQMELAHAYRDAVFRSFVRGHEITSLELGSDIRLLPTVERKPK